MLYELRTIIKVNNVKNFVYKELKNKEFSSNVLSLRFILFLSSFSHKAECIVKKDGD